MSRSNQFWELVDLTPGGILIESINPNCFGQQLSIHGVYNPWDENLRFSMFFSNVSHILWNIDVNDPDLCSPPADVIALDFTEHDGKQRLYVTTASGFDMVIDYEKLSIIKI